MRRDLIETNEGSGLGSLGKTSIAVPTSRLQEEKAEQVSAILSTAEKGKIKEEKEPEKIRQPELLVPITKNAKIEDVPEKIPYLNIPKNLGGEGKNALLKIIGSKVSPAFLEKTSLKMMMSALIMGFIGVAIEADISLLGALGWYAEKYTIIEGLQWYGSFLSRFPTKDMLAFSAISLVFLGAVCLGVIEFLCTLNVGKFSKIITDHKTRTMHYHIERNAQKLKEAGYFGMAREVQNVLKDTVDELYNSGKIQAFDTIILDSYLLTNEGVFRKLRGNIEKILPFAQITEIPERPLGKDVKGALEIRNIKERWGEYLSARDTLIKRVLAPLVCSRKLGTVGSFSALVWHGLGKSEVLRFIASPFISKNSQENSSKKQFSTTRGLCIKLPKERRENKNSL